MAESNINNTNKVSTPNTAVSSTPIQRNRTPQQRARRRQELQRQMQAERAKQKQNNSTLNLMKGWGRQYGGRMKLIGQKAKTDALQIGNMIGLASDQAVQQAHKDQQALRDQHIIGQLQDWAARGVVQGVSTLVGAPILKGVGKGLNYAGKGLKTLKPVQTALNAASRFIPTASKVIPSASTAANAASGAASKGNIFTRIIKAPFKALQTVADKATILKNKKRYLDAFKRTGRPMDQFGQFVLDRAKQVDTRAARMAASKAAKLPWKSRYIGKPLKGAAKLLWQGARYQGTDYLIDAGMDSAAQWMSDSPQNREAIRNNILFRATKAALKGRNAYRSFNSAFSGGNNRRIGKMDLVNYYMTGSEALEGFNKNKNPIYSQQQLLDPTKGTSRIHDMFGVNFTPQDVAKKQQGIAEQGVSPWLRFGVAEIDPRDDYNNIYKKIKLKDIHSRALRAQSLLQSLPEGITRQQQDKLISKMSPENQRTIQQYQAMQNMYNKVTGQDYGSNVDITPMLNSIPNKPAQLYTNFGGNAIGWAAQKTGMIDRAVKGKANEIADTLYAIGNAKTPQQKKAAIQKYIQIQNQYVHPLYRNAISQFAGGSDLQETGTQIAQKYSGSQNLQKIHKGMKQVADFTDPVIQQQTARATQAIAKGAGQQYSRQINTQVKQAAETGDVRQVVQIAKRVVGLQKVQGQSTPQNQQTKAIIKKTLGSQALSNPGLWPDMISLFFKSRGMDTAGDILGNPIIFWVGLGSLLLAPFAGSITNGVGNIMGNLRGQQSQIPYRPLVNFGGNGAPVGG